MNRFLVVFIIILLISTATYGKVEDCVPELPFVDVVTNNEPKANISAVGAFKQGIPVIILGENGSYTCRAETSKIKMFDHQTNPFQITNLKTETKCHNHNFIGALVGVTDVKYRYIKMSQFKDARITKQIYGEVIKTQNPKGSNLFQLKESNAHYWLLPDNKSKLIVAQIARQDFANGPLFVYSNGKLFSLKGDCTKDIKTFSINNRTYIKYTETGCDSGVYIIHVYDLSGSKPCEVYYNSSFST